MDIAININKISRDNNIIIEDSGIFFIITGNNVRDSSILLLLKIRTLLYWR